jgi:hypothetical protein
MAEELSLEDLWQAARPGDRLFAPDQLKAVPDKARLYLRHAIAPGAVLANAVRLKMHGEIKLNTWRPFHAGQIISWDRGMIWRAGVKLHGIPIRGGDSWLDGQGAMRWRLFGIVPMINASGPDITRSAAGRVNIESIWLPSVLCHNAISWTASDDSHLHAHFTAHDEHADIDYLIDDASALRSVNMPRWGNPEGGDFHFAKSGGFVEQSAPFGAYTIPSRMRVGWHFGTERFEPEGEFFRVTIDDAVYR